MKELNLGLRFLLEIALLLSVGYGGFLLGNGLWKWVFAIACAGFIAVICGFWIAPHSPNRLADPWRLGLEVVLFSIAIIALWLSQHTSLAIVLGGVVVTNLILMFLWHQR